MRSPQGSGHAADLGTAFLRAYRRSVAHGGSKSLSANELSFLSSLEAKVAASTSGIGDYHANEFVDVLRSIQAMQSRSKRIKSTSPLAALLSRATATAERLRVYGCMLEQARDDGMQGKNTYYTRWAKSDDTSRARSITSAPAAESEYRHGGSAGGYSFFNPPGTGVCLVAGPGQRIVQDANGYMVVVPRR
jgi:hypothetical protein